MKTKSVFPTFSRSARRADTLRASIAFALALTAAARGARADGVAIAPNALADADRQALVGQIAAYRAQHPEAFDAIRNLRGVRPEFYKQFRKPAPDVTRELRALGAPVLLPMLDALAFDAPAYPGMNDAERTALSVGLLDAVGLLRDARSGPVLRVAFEASANRDAGVQRAAAEAVGRLGTDADLALLTAHLGASDPLRRAALAGLGACRRVEGAKALAAQLATADAGAAEIAAKALGALGSSWAWKALGPSAQATGNAVRAIAAKALVEAFARQANDVRDRIGKSLRMVEEPTTLDLIAAARASADAETAKALDGLAADMRRSLAH